MATTHRLRWWENVDVSGGVQLTVLTLWGLFVVVGHLLSEYRRLPWMVHRIQPAIVSTALGGIVFLGMFVALRQDATAGGRGDAVVRVNRMPILLLLSGAAMAFITRSITECLLFAWVLVLAWAAGRMASRKIDLASEDTELSEFITSVGIGLSLLILITTALGFAGWLYTSVVYLLLSGITVMLLRPIVAIIGQLWDVCFGPRRDPHPEPDGFRAVSISLMVALIAMSSMSAMAPEVGYDALTYHLAASKVFAEQHRIVEIPQMTPSYWPANGMVLYTFAQLLSGPKLAKLFNFGFGLLLTATIYVLARRHLSREVAIRAALIFCSLPLVFWESGTAYNDLSMSFFCLVGILLFLDASRPSADLYGMALAGLAFGTAMGFKPFILVIMAPLAITLLIGAARRGTPPLGRSIVSILVMFCISAIFSFHWYLRSYLYTGNPLFPYLNSLFRSPYWAGPDLMNLSMFGMGAKPLDLLMLPWNITFYPERFAEAGSLGVLFLAFLPLLPHAKNPGGAGPWLFLVCGGFLIFWVATGQAARYLLPILPLVAILYSAALVRFCQERLPSRRLPRWIVHAVLVIAIVEQAVLWFPLDDTRFPYTVVLGKESDTEYLARVHPVSKVWAYANEHLSPETKMLSVVNEFTFFSNHRPIPYSYFSAVLAARHPECFPDFRAADSTYRSLIRCGYTHILIDRSSPYFKSGQFDHTVLTRDSFYDTYLEQEYAFREVSLYKVRKL